jgi:hypothetical protein
LAKLVLRWTAPQTLVATTGMGALQALSCAQDILTQCGPLVNSIFWSGAWSGPAALCAAAVCAARIACGRDQQHGVQCAVRVEGP